MEDRYQVILQNVENHLDNKINVLVRIAREPTNPVDINAVKVKADINSDDNCGLQPLLLLRKIPDQFTREFFNQFVGEPIRSNQITPC